MHISSNIKTHLHSNLLPLFNCPFITLSPSRSSSHKVLPLYYSLLAKVVFTQSSISLDLNNVLYSLLLMFIMFMSVVDSYIKIYNSVLQLHHNRKKKFCIKCTFDKSLTDCSRHDDASGSGDTFSFV